LSPQDVLTLVRNGFEASFIDDRLRVQYELQLDNAMAQWTVQHG